MNWNRKEVFPMKCSVCGCENEDHITVCTQCHAELAPSVPKVFCRHCGKQIRVTAKYCVYCGMQRADAPDPMVAPTSPLVAVEDMPEKTPAPIAAPAQDIPHPAVEIPVPVAAPVFVPVVTTAPAYQLPTERGFWKMFFLGLLTAMLYPLAILSRISMEINIVASRYDGKRTIHFLWMPLLTAITLGIYPLVWFHNLCNRIGDELQRRHICYNFSADTFWGWNFLWCILGSLLTAALAAALLLLNLLGREYLILITTACGILSSIGPCIFVAKLMRATNLMNADYNEKG